MRHGRTVYTSPMRPLTFDSPTPSAIDQAQRAFSLKFCIGAYALSLLATVLIFAQVGPSSTFSMLAGMGAGFPVGHLLMSKVFTRQEKAVGVSTSVFLFVLFLLAVYSS